MSDQLLLMLALDLMGFMFMALTWSTRSALGLLAIPCFLAGCAVAFLPSLTPVI